MGPHARQTGEHVVVSGQFHLHLGIGGFGPLGKDFQDQAGPVDDRRIFDNAFDITLLHRGELVIKNNIVDLVFLAVLGDFFQFAAADIGGVVGLIDPLDEFFVTHCTGGFRQKLQFVQVFQDRPLVVVRADDSNEDCFFCVMIVHKWLFLLAKKGHPVGDGLIVLGRSFIGAGRSQGRYRLPSRRGRAACRVSTSASWRPRAQLPYPARSQRHGEPSRWKRFRLRLR